MLHPAPGFTVAGTAAEGNRGAHNLPNSWPAKTDQTRIGLHPQDHYVHFSDNLKIVSIIRNHMMVDMCPPENGVVLPAVQFSFAPRTATWSVV